MLIFCQSAEDVFFIAREKLLNSCMEGMRCSLSMAGSERLPRVAVARHYYIGHSHPYYFNFVRFLDSSVLLFGNSQVTLYKGRACFNTQKLSGIDTLHILEKNLSNIFPLSLIVHEFYDAWPGHLLYAMYNHSCQ